MITFLAVNTTGMFSHGVCKTIPLHEQGRVYITGTDVDRGTSNGIGKSSILNAVKQIAFGENDTGHGAGDVVNTNKLWNKGQFGVLWFINHDDIKYRVIQTRKWTDEEIGTSIIGTEPSTVLSTGNTYTGTDVFVEYWDGDEWVDDRPTSQGAKTILDIQKYVCKDVLKMTIDQFSAYVSIGQRAMSVLTNGTSGEREKIIKAVVDVSLWERAAELAKVKASSIQVEVDALNIRHQTMEGWLSKFTYPSDHEMSEVVVGLESLKLAKQVADQERQTAVAEYSAAQSALLTAETASQAHARQMDALRQHYDSLQLERGAVSFRPIKYSDTHEELKAKIAEYSLDKAILAKELAAIKNNVSGICPYCKQTLPSHPVENHSEETVNKIKSLDLLISDANRQLFMLEQFERSNYNIETEALVKDIDLKIKTILQSISAMSTQVDHSSLKNDLLLKQSHLNTKEIAFKSIVRDIQVATKQLEDMVARRDQYTKALDEKNALAGTIESKLLDVQHAQFLDKHFKKIKLQEYDVSIERLNQLLAEELETIWPGGATARFVTAQTKASGKGVKQGIDLIVSVTGRGDIPIGMYSGGESKMIVFAVFLAMRTLAFERGVGVNFAAVDEIDDALDNTNIDNLILAFDRLKHTDTCLIISHNSRFVNSMDFDNTWTITKKNDMSSVDYTGDYNARF